MNRIIAARLASSRICTVALVLSLTATSSAFALQAPQLSIPSTLDAVVGQPLSLKLDVGGDPAPVVLALGLPTGLNLTAGILGGVPTQPGQYPITVLATNILGTELKILTLNVTNPLGTPPAITSSLQANGTVGTAFTYAIDATGTAPLLVTAQNLPTGLAQVGNAITGTPTSAGEFDIPLSVTNAAGADNKTLHLSVSAAGVAPSLTGSLNLTGTVGVPLDVTIPATGSTPLNFVITNLAPGLTAVGNHITGTPTQAGVFPINISVSNPVSTSQNILTLTVGANTKPSITSALAASATAGTAFTYTITATGTAPITFGAANLPTGLTLQGAVISGTPTASGTFDVTLAAMNSAGNDIKTLVLSVASNPNLPQGDPLPGGEDTDGDGIPNATDPDDDNDGFSDVIEIAAGSDPKDPNSTPIGGSAASPAQLLDIRKMTVKLNFARSLSDSIQISGMLAVPLNLNLNTQRVAMDVGGIPKLFTLTGTTKRGLAKSGADSFKMSIKKARKGVTNTQNGTFTMRLMKGDWQTNLAKYGLTNTTAVKQLKTVPVTFLFNSTLYTKTQNQYYTAKQGRSGRTK